MAELENSDSQASSQMHWPRGHYPSKSFEHDVFCFSLDIPRLPTVFPHSDEHCKDESCEMTRLALLFSLKPHYFRDYGSEPACREMLQFMRTFHPGLRKAKRVDASQNATPPFWVIPWSEEDEAPYSTHAGGFEIHMSPKIRIPEFPWPASAPHFMEDFHVGLIDAHGFLSEKTVRQLKMFMPSAVGIRLWRSGYLTFLFRKESDLTELRSLEPHRWIPVFGGLKVLVDVLSSERKARTGLSLKEVELPEANDVHGNPMAGALEWEEGERNRAKACVYDHHVLRMDDRCFVAGSEYLWEEDDPNISERTPPFAFLNQTSKRNPNETSARDPRNENGTVGYVVAPDNGTNPLAA
ncbi:hypothetical protein BJ508DRAFT_322413 [Ascobolus immersus RN42]|uniref:DUF4283 domain-containing protein n=1 Tax=Ascobolus immersus RN42 TaxID=1160509 RepID=A0A3N4IIZ4_ASCIM|nr:hypothetical protein BJ508DRAFT_322413 [Ascobolus immersus RN42]